MPSIRSILVLTIGTLAGCQALRTGTNPSKDPPSTTAIETAPAWPGKNSIRVSQFVFFADFELRKDDPLFIELSDLRDQIVRDLQLPTANSAIQVYLFEDRERYER